MTDHLTARILGRILMSAGTRKMKGESTELGEDAAGLLQGPTWSAFWVCDGSSGSAHIGPFSARSLAIALGRYYFSRVIAMPDPEILAELDATIDQVLTAWQQHLEGILASPSDLKALEEAFTMPPDSGAEDGDLYFPHHDFAATMIAGVLRNDGSLDYAKAGDCGLVAMDDGDVPHISSKQDDRIALRLQRLDKGSYRFIRGTGAISTVKLEGIQTVHAGSDGIMIMRRRIAEQARHIFPDTDQCGDCYDDKALVTLWIDRGGRHG